MKKNEIINYWQEREKAYMDVTEKERQKLIEVTQHHFEELEDVLQGVINTWLTKYANDNNMTLADTKKAVSQAEIERLAKKAEKYVKEVQALFEKGLDPSLAKEAFTQEAIEEMRLYNLTMRVNRLEALKTEIGYEITRFYSNEAYQELELHTRETLKEYQRMANVLSADFEVTTQKIAKIALGTHLTGSVGVTWSALIWGQSKSLKLIIDRELTQAMIRGYSPLEMARRLRKAVSDSVAISKHQAERLARTEMARIQGEVQQDSFTKAKMKKYIYIAEPTACKVCNRIDGHIFSTDDIQVGKNYYPMHPNCMCATAPFIDPEEVFNKYLGVPHTQSQKIITREMDDITDYKISGDTYYRFGMDWSVTRGRKRKKSK